ncbi:hypothetical protein Nepgr_008883 [Nepenthes gracilis]|uniref:Reverse transcriptase domain-containing protein n=1 Tax=Nepenthes gracilis TaxID=150966 RepID=A0AAD3S9S5_NEPGR|nr:hypothetical protein Nepgr_008883 [Nepenthes gracilis]
MEVYVDDMLVKSRVTGDHIRDLEESFGVLHQHQMKLNPANGCQCLGELKRVSAQPTIVGITPRRRGAVPLLGAMSERPSAPSLCAGESISRPTVYYSETILWAHRIVVLTDQPLKGILQKPDVSGRLVKWAIELGEFDIEFRPRPAIKAQALADFIVETTTPIKRNSPPKTKNSPVGSQNGLSMWMDHPRTVAVEHG